MAIKKDGVFTYHILQDRERKNLAILELIRKRGPISKAEISRLLGYNIVSITNYVDYYIEKRIILEVGLDVSSGGRRPELLELNARGGNIVGVNIGPETITAVVTDLKITPLSAASSARPSESLETLIPEAIKVIDEAIKKSRVDPRNIKNIGIGFSGIVDYASGTLHDTDPARGRTKTSFLKFVSSISDKFGLPVYIGNDASCAAFGEKTLSPGADVDNLVYLYSDVGCGMIVHGEVYPGASGCAGETQLVFANLPKDDKKGPKEYTYLRPLGVDLGIVSEAQAVVEKGGAPELSGLVKGDAKRITKEMVVEAAKKGDKTARDLVACAGRHLGVRIAYMVNLFNPEVVVIGGGVEKAGDVFMDEVKAAVKKLAFEEHASMAKIMPSLLEEKAVVLGAAALAAREVFIQV